MSGLALRLETEIFKRNKAEEEQAKSVSLLQAILESTGDGILVVDNLGQWAGFNRQFVHLWNLPDDVIAQKDDDICLQYVLDQLQDPMSFLKKVKDLYDQPEAICSDTLEFKDGRLIERYSQPQKINGVTVGRVWRFQDNSEQFQHERELRAIATVSNALRSAETKAQMIPIILDQMMELLNAENADLELIDPITGDAVMESGTGIWAALKGMRIPADKGLNRYIRSNRKPYLNNHVLEDPMVLDPVSQIDCEAMIGAPMISQGELIGFLWVGRKLDYSEGDIRPLAAIADMAANAIRRASLFEQTEQWLKQLTALREIDISINSNQNLSATFNIILEQTMTLLHVDAAILLKQNPQTKTLEYAVEKGFLTQSSRTNGLNLYEALSRKPLPEDSYVHFMNLAQSDIDPQMQEMIANEGFISYFAISLIAKGEFKGLMQVFKREIFTPDEEWINFLETLAGQAAIAIDNAQLFQDLQYSNIELQQAYDATIEGWSSALDLRDKETEGHSQRVTDMTLVMAVRMGISQQELVHMRRGALLHDIGKMGIPDKILLKPDKLTNEEWAIMQQHPEIAFQLLSPIAYLQPALDIPYCHHEKWDGSGYPRGLKGEEIPLAARVFAIVDVWDALTSDRPYRKAWTAERSRQYILEQSGKHFDPQVVVVFQKMIDEYTNKH
jgi:HD-GYP domain-containing protein (c-di-GMP phosphodiesterase class II)